MRRRNIQVLAFIFLLAATGASATEGLFQVNTVFQRSSYPLFGTSGKDVIRHSSAGIALKSTRGDGLHGVLDLAVLFPYKYEEKLYPSKDFSNRDVDGFPIGLDGLVGIGYLFDLHPLAFMLSGGFHTGALFEGGDYLAAFGIGLDFQTRVTLGKVLTAQVGLKFALDFGGIQTFVSGSNEFAGLPSSFAVYTGMGLSY